MYGVVFVVLVLIGGLSYWGKDEFRGFLHSLALPIFSTEQSIVASASTLSLLSRAALIQENNRLAEALREASARLADRDVLARENAKLKEMFGRTDTRSLTLAAVLSKPNRSPYDTLLIDVGSSMGITPNQLVLAYENIPIGTIAEVYENTSLVRLFSSPGQTLLVDIGSTTIQGTAVGVGGGNFRIALPKDAAVAEGDNVSLPGISPNVIGTIHTIVRSEADTFAQILFNSPVNIYQLTRVFVQSN